MWEVTPTVTACVFLFLKKTLGQRPVLQTPWLKWTRQEKENVIFEPERPRKHGYCNSTFSMFFLPSGRLGYVFFSFTSLFPDIWRLWKCFVCVLNCNDRSCSGLGVFFATETYDSTFRFQPASATLVKLKKKHRKSTKTDQPLFVAPNFECSPCNFREFPDLPRFQTHGTHVVWWWAWIWWAARSVEGCPTAASSRTEDGINSWDEQHICYVETHVSQMWNKK